MTSDHGPSFEQTASIAAMFVGLSSEAQRIVGLLSKLPSRLADQNVRTEVRTYLLACDDVGVDPIGVERARAVLAAYEGIIGGQQEPSAVRRVA
jgi:hypothetical protein